VQKLKVSVILGSNAYAWYWAKRLCFFRLWDVGIQFGLINVSLDIGHRQRDRKRETVFTQGIILYNEKGQHVYLQRVIVKVNLRLDNLATSLVTRQRSSLRIEYDLNFAWKMSHKI